MSASDVQPTLKACAGAVGEFIEDAPPRANVRGLGVGCKWSEGCPTGEPALVILVNQKVGKEQLTKADMVPATLQGMRTDVLAVGEVFAGNNDVGVQTLAKRLRPAEGGYSVGHFKITAGTIATCVYDVLPGGSTSVTPAHGVGIPPRVYILSNNHVLANVNAAAIGDAIPPARSVRRRRPACRRHRQAVPIRPHPAHAGRAHRRAQQPRRCRGRPGSVP